MVTNKLSAAQRNAPQRVQPVQLYDLDGNYAGIGSQRSVGYRRLVLAAAAMNVGTPPVGAVRAEIRVEGGSVRYLDTGEMPTTTYGMPMYPTDANEYIARVSDLWFIKVSGNPVVNILFYGVTS